MFRQSDSLFVCAFVFAFLACSGCTSLRDPTIDYVGMKQHNVTNGVAHDKAIVRTSGIDTVIVPDTDCVVRQSHSPDTIVIRMEKTLSFAGLPPEPVSIDGIRSTAGFASARRGRTLVFSTYGEFDTIEGGFYIKSSFEIPSNMTVIQQKKLSGEESRAQQFFIARQLGCSLEEESSENGVLEWSPCPDAPDTLSAER